MRSIVGLLLINATGLLLGGDNSSRARTEERFTFTARAAMEQVAPLFGAEKERVWSPNWNPKFISPVPADDTPGMVFAVRHSGFEAIWVNTAFDLKNGRIQYAYFIPDALVTVITLKLTPAGDRTKVEVTYERTALTEEADAHVRHLAEQDRKAGPEWESAIDRYLARQAGGAQ